MRIIEELQDTSTLYELGFALLTLVVTSQRQGAHEDGTTQYQYPYQVQPSKKQRYGGKCPVDRLDGRVGDDPLEDLFGKLKQYRRQ